MSTEAQNLWLELSEAKEQLEAMQAEVEGYQVALLWAESHDPWLVEKIREKVASLSKDKL